MNKKDDSKLKEFICRLLLREPIKTGLSKKEVIEFIDEKELPIKLYALLLDEDTIVIHKLRNIGK